MRDHNKAFCRLVAETFDCPGPVYEFGSYQVEGQDDYAEPPRACSPASRTSAATCGPGPGVDRVEDVSAISLADGSAGTVLCIETFEHVFEVRRAFDEVFRVLKPGGLFVITSPLNFRIHGYPDDYWRMTPNCLRRMMAPYDGAADRLPGPPHVPALGHGAWASRPRPRPTSPRRADALVAGLPATGSREAEASLPARARSSGAGCRQLYRSKGERYQVAGYYTADFTIDVDGSLAQAG